jgi:hypothetical protein
MALKTVLDTLDGVDDAFKSLYSEADGKFVLQLDDVDNHPTVANLKNAYGSEKTKRQEQGEELAAAKAKLAGFPDDFDLDVWKGKAVKKPDETAQIELRKTLEAERDEWKGKFEVANGTIRENAITRTLEDALVASGVGDDGLRKAAANLLKPSVSVDDKGNGFIDSDVGPLSVQEHVAKWVSTEGQSFVSKPKGGGSKGGAGGAGKSSDPLGKVPGFNDLPEK